MTELMVKIENVNGILVTTSNRVAEELGVEHKNLIRKIEDYIIKFGSSNLSREFYIESTFENRGKKYKNYLITKKGIAQLIGGYSSAVERAFELNVAYINKFEEMEAKLSLKAPTTLKEALILALEQQETIEKLEIENKVKTQQIAELQPKGTYYDLVLQCNGLLSITIIAKDYGESGQWLNKKLHKLGVQYKQGDIWLLYQKYANKGYTKTKTQPINRNDGPDVKVHTYWTQKGRLFIYDILKSVGILPEIERKVA